MGDQQNEWGTNDTPRTYGDDSKLYESGANPYGSQPNPYEQPNYGAGQPNYGGSQPNYGGSQPNPYEQPNYGGGQPNYGSGQPNPYGAQQYGGWQGDVNPQMRQTPVTDVFCNILLGIFAVRLIISFILIYQAYGAVDDYYGILNGSYLLELNESGYQVLSVFSNLLTVAMIVFVVLDIVKISKAHYKIVGLILFAILLNPGYYLWRAHILGRKKTFPIVYTVIYGGGTLAYFAYSFYKAFVFAFQFTQELM